jgi:chloramphenicol O-acetyltransferase
MKRAVIWGSAMASFTVEKFGTERIAELTNEEINTRLEEFKSLVSVDIQLV